MKNIIKTAICLIVISSILLYSSVSKAATATFSVIVPDTISSVLIDSYISSTDSNDQYNYFTFESTFALYIEYSNDAFVTGYFNTSINVSPSALTGYILTGTEFVFDPVSNESFTSVMYKPNIQQMNIYSGVQITTFFDNYGVTTNRIPCGTMTYRFTLKSLNYVPATMPLVNISASVGGNHTYISSNPQTTAGLGSVIKTAITNALQNSELDLVYDYLTLWKTTQDGYLADIELSVDDVETWLSYINSAQATLQNKIDLIYVLEQTFPGYFNSMISLLQQIRDMNASDTAAESQMQNAEQQLSQAVNDMEVQKPNINNVVNAGDQYMDSNITGAQGDTFFWLHGTNIFVTILTMAVTIGILGFVIYGKSG